MWLCFQISVVVGSSLATVGAVCARPCLTLILAHASCVDSVPLSSFTSMEPRYWTHREYRVSIPSEQHCYTIKHFFKRSNWLSVLLFLLFELNKCTHLNCSLLCVESCISSMFTFSWCNRVAPEGQSLAPLCGHTRWTRSIWFNKEAANGPMFYRTMFMATLEHLMCETSTTSVPFQETLFLRVWSEQGFQWITRGIFTAPSVTLQDIPPQPRNKLYIYLRGSIRHVIRNIFLNNQSYTQLVRCASSWFTSTTVNVS